MSSSPVESENPFLQPLIETESIVLQSLRLTSILGLLKMFGVIPCEIDDTHIVPVGTHVCHLPDRLIIGVIPTPTPQAKNIPQPSITPTEGAKTASSHPKGYLSGSGR